jgi:tetratricopeptide (TPR) repeat protein
MMAAVLVVSVSAMAGPAWAKDCGERPTGKNPSTEELLEAMEELSLQFQVPVEIIVAVAHRESGIQQWRSSGKLVVNEKDCGFGMMQLTGATAEQFDVPRLKAEWRYNLECGVNVLQRKWRRAEREKWKAKGGKLPAPDRAVLENWYYALSYYQGRRTGEYPGKIFNHMRERPGRVAALLAAPVEVSNPDDAVEGFSYGMGYTALRGDRVVLDDGRTLKVKTTIGTLGNPELVAQLGEALERAENALERGQTGKAVRWFRLVATNGANTAAGRKAVAALETLAKQAREALVAADAMRAAGDYAGALDAYDELEDRYEGLPEAETAADHAQAIRTDPELAARAEELEREARARRLLAVAERAVERSDHLEALRRLRLLAEEYADSEAGTRARAKLTELEQDEELMAAVRAAEQARALRQLIARADSYRANGLYDRAVATYEEALRLGPEGEQLERCREGLRLAEEMRDW